MGTLCVSIIPGWQIHPVVCRMYVCAFPWMIRLAIGLHCNSFLFLARSLPIFFLFQLFFYLLTPLTSTNKKREKGKDTTEDTTEGGKKRKKK